MQPGSIKSRGVVSPAQHTLRLVALGGTSLLLIMTNDTRWGATPEEWNEAARYVGPDLLPSFCNPDPSITRTPGLPAVFNEKTGKYQSLSKTPSVATNSGGVRGIVDWTRHTATLEHVQQWRADPDHGVLMICRTIKAIDIDIEDKELADKIEQFFIRRLGVDFPARARSNSGKRTLLLRFAEPRQIKKSVIPVVKHIGLANEEKMGVVEFLADRQQTLLFGTHPSGVRFDFRTPLNLDPNSPPRERTLRLGDTPIVDYDALAQAWADLADAFVAADEKGKIKLTGLNDTTYLNHNASVAVDDPVVAFLESTGWIRGGDSSGRVNVRCPWESEHSSETTPSSTSWLPAGLNGGQRGAFKCLHSHGEKYGTREFLQAVGYAEYDLHLSFAATTEHRPEPKKAEAIVLAESAEVAVIPSDLADAMAIAAGEETMFSHVRTQTTFMRDNKGNIESSPTNVNVALRENPDWIRCRRDEFTGKVTVSHMGGGWIPQTPELVTILREDLDRLFKIKANPNDIQAGLDVAAKLNSHNSARDWLVGQKWDGKPRIANFAKDILKCEDTEYSTEVSRYLWYTLAGRTLLPGVKADAMVMLLSPKQGRGKSTVVQKMSPRPEWFSADMSFSKEDAENTRIGRGKVIIEMAEMKGLDTQHSTHIKAWMSKPADEYRPLYKEQPETVKRTWMLIGTDNRHNLLSDPTGNRRFLPLRVTVTDEYIDHFALDDQAELAQYWAEAKHHLMHADSIGKELERIVTKLNILAEPHREAATILDEAHDDVKTYLETLPAGAKVYEREIRSAITEGGLLRGAQGTKRLRAILEKLEWEQVCGSTAYRQREGSTKTRPKEKTAFVF